jgi:serine/threonine protein kinase
MYRLEENQKFGRYRVVHYLGIGPTGTSYEAEDTRISRPVLLKLVQPWLPLSDATRRHFFRLMQDISYFNHPALAPIFNFGEAHGHLYVIREYTPYGSLLGDYGRQGLKPPLSTQTAIALLNQLAPALSYIHSQGQIHGSLTFTNILLKAEPPQITARALLSITDIGLAHIIRSVGQPQTPQLPLTAAPEQYKKQVSARSDQYALAILLYFWLTGRPPFLGMPGEIEQAKQTESYTLMRTHNSHVSIEQEIAIRRALSAQPEARYPSIRDFVAAFSLTQRLPPDLPTTEPIFSPVHASTQVPLPNQSTVTKAVQQQNSAEQSNIEQPTIAPRASQSGPLPQQEPDIPQPRPAPEPLPSSPPEPVTAPATEPEPPQVEPPADPVVLPRPEPDIAQPLPDPTPFPFTPVPETQPEKENILTSLIQAQTGSVLGASLLITTAINSRKVRFQLKQGETYLGHAGSSDILLEDDPQVSRHHALIQYEDEAFFISDQRSTYGVMVNGHKLIGEQRLRLRHNDSIEIGHYTLVFSLHELAHEQAIAQKREPASIDRQLAS